MNQSSGRETVRQVALVCFFISGVSGLIYEVTWTRMLGLVFGNTVFATSTVLAAYMAGLALGSYLAGRYADQLRRSLRAYAFLEMGIGVYCFFVPLLIKLIEIIYLPVQRSFHLSFYSSSLFRFVLCFLLLLIPSTLMGATTPIFSRFYIERNERFGHGIGRVYALNTFGAFLGVVLSGFFMVERLGVRNTINSAVIANMCVAILCLLIGRRSLSQSKTVSQEASEPIGETEKSRVVLTLLMIGFGISGFAAMVYEVAWTRILAMILGSSTYAFSIMLATFLLGLALGSIIFSMVAKRIKVGLIWFGAVELAIGLSALIMLPVFGKMPFYLVSLFDRLGRNYPALEVSKSLLCVMVMIVPTILLGSLFPMVTQICTRSYSELGRKVGTIYSVNTLGNIGGSFLSGFVLVPHIGIQNSIILAAILNMTVGCALFFTDHTVKLGQRMAISLSSVAVGVLCALMIPSWDRMVISSGPTVYAPRYMSVKGDERKIEMSGIGDELLYYREGTNATIAVKKSRSGTIVMAVDGKVDASNSGDMYTQLMVGHIPLMLSDDPETALVIGLGSGVTLGAAARYPLKRIDCVEIEPAVVEASVFFNKENRNVLKDPRVNMVVDDGRNYLAVNTHKYDVIISEPSNLWLAGIVNLFTREFYQLCRERLVSGGIMCQWSQSYQMTLRDLKIVINTFQSVFPHTTVWLTTLGDMVMIGSDEELSIDCVQLAARYNVPGVRSDLQALKIREPLALLCCYLLDEEGVRQLVKGAIINTDDRPILEYSAPRNLYVYKAASNTSIISGFRTVVFPKMENCDQWVTESASFWYNLGLAYEFKEMSYKAFSHYEKAISVDKSFAPAYVGLGLNLYKRDRLEDAIEKLKMAAALDPSDAAAYYHLAQIYRDQALKDEAISAYRSAIRLSPQPGQYQQELADLLVEYGDYSAAIREYESALKGGGEKSRIMCGLARAYKSSGMTGSAISKLQEAIAADPSFAPLYRELGALFEAKGDYKKAASAYEKLVELEPASSFGHAKLSLVYKLLGDLPSSRREADKARVLEALE